MDWLKAKTSRYLASRIYRPLSTDRKETRLVTIQAGWGSSPIRCTLNTIYLDDPDSHPSYTALSYVWGSTENPQEIHVNGKRLLVTDNLNVALKNFRRPTEDLCLWVDAICVNQMDLKERGQQVLLMRDVYSQAQSTLIWLGPEADNSDKAMDLIELFNYIHSEYNFTTGFELINPDAWGDPSEWGIEEELEALAALLVRPWFFRIWVVQEAAMSKDLIVCCGTRQTGWLDLIACEEIFNGVQLTSYFSHYTWNGLERLRNMEKVASVYQNPSITSQATDPRDKCVALLGLADVSHRQIPVNVYSLSVCEVYCSTIARISRQDHTWPLKFLICSGDLRGRPDLPSWVPDWSCSQYPGHFIAWWQIPMVGEHGTGLGTIPYNPTRGLDVNMMKLVDFQNNTVLCACGVVLDTISEYTATMYGGAGRTVPKRQARSDESFIRQDRLSRDYPTGEAHEDVVWRVLLLNRNWYGAPMSTEKCKQVLYWVMKIHVQRDDDQNWEPSPGEPADVLPHFALYTTMKSIHIGDTTVGEVIREQVLKVQDDFAPERSEILDVEAPLAAATGGRRMAATKKGYLGFMPTWTEKDDILAILFGCPVPVILREHDGWYEFIGTCYFHGVMEGEMVPGIQSGEFKIQNFEMR